jgi:hypothetical protein
MERLSNLTRGRLDVPKVEIDSPERNLQMTRCVTQERGSAPGAVRANVRSRLELLKNACEAIGLSFKSPHV